ncbi:hypothetical protein HYE68_003011 [Fusarium pseudograminearum]|nr:hypothetical protein HYE68_003011 [Fusarium pseudograminearum]
MSDTTAQNAQGAFSIESSTPTGRSIANGILTKNITSRVKADPSIDLSQFLQQQAALYPQLCKNLSQRRGSNSSSSSTSSQTDGKDQGSVSATKAASEFQLTNNINIIYSLDDSIVSLASARQTPTEPESKYLAALASGLNQAINDSQTLWRLHNTAVLQISPSQVVKVSTSLDHDSMTNLQYIRKHVQEVPTPSCLGALQCGPWTYAFMTRAEGETLEAVWPRLLTSHKRSIQQQLNTIFQQLRLKGRGLVKNNPTPQRIGSFVSRRCKDTRRDLREAEMPIQQEAQFNDFLCRQPRRTETPWIKMVRSFMSDDHELVMTHGDLHPRNIMVRWDSHTEVTAESEKCIRITSLIDWEVAGWYPAYWEFVKALSTVPQRGPLADWCDYLPTEAIGSWPKEFAMDLLISRWLG